MSGGWYQRNLCFAIGLLIWIPLRASWVPLGPFGGSASIVVADPHSPGTFVVGTRNALLFRSHDGGESWTPLQFPAQLHADLNTLAIDPLTQGVYLSGLSSDLPQYSGILRSTDAGTTWHQVPELRNQQVRAIAFMRANSKMVAAGTDTGVFLSQNGGITWSRISPADNSQLRPIMSLAFDPINSSTLYAGTPHLPWKTLDGGASWRSIHAGMLDDSDVFSIQVDRNRPQRVFASACSGIYRSLNGGAKWTKLTAAKDVSYRTYVIIQDPQYENVWFAGTTHGMMRSRDGGESWEKIGPFSTRSIEFDPGQAGRVFIASDEAGILRSEDRGTTWRPINQGFCNRTLSSLWTSAGGIYTITREGPKNSSLLRLVRDSGDWEKVPKAASRSIMTALASPVWSPNLLLSKTGSALLISEEAGRRPTSPVGGEVNGLVSTHAGVLLAATSSGLKGSDDLGASWYPIQGELETDTVQAICRHPEMPAVLFAAKYGVIFRSSDAGRSWARVSPQHWPISSVRQLTVVPGPPSRLLVLTQQQGIWALPFETELSGR